MIIDYLVNKEILKPAIKRCMDSSLKIGQILSVVSSIVGARTMILGSSYRRGLPTVSKARPQCHKKRKEISLNIDVKPSGFHPPACYGQRHGDSASPPLCRPQRRVSFIKTKTGLVTIHICTFFCDLMPYIKGLAQHRSHQKLYRSTEDGSKGFPEKRLRHLVRLPSSGR